MFVANQFNLWSSGDPTSQAGQKHGYCMDLGDCNQCVADPAATCSPLTEGAWKWTCVDHRGKEVSPSQVAAMGECNGTCAEGASSTNTTSILVECVTKDDHVEWKVEGKVMNSEEVAKLGDDRCKARCQGCTWPPHQEFLATWNLDCSCNARPRASRTFGSCSQPVDILRKVHGTVLLSASL